MAVNSKKLEKLMERSSELDKKIKSDSAQKAKCDEEIEKIQARQLRAFLTENKLKMNDELFEMIALIKSAEQNGLTAADLKRLIEIKKNSEDNSDEEIF